MIPFFPYRAFFLYIEPVSALVGAYYAAFRPAEYLQLLTMKPLATTSVEQLSTPVSMSLFQLANLYLLFALNECLVLSSTDSIKTWKRVLVCLFIADLGHLVTMAPLGGEVFWRFWEWNAMIWGSVGFVYAGATMRLCFLLGLGVRDESVSRKSV